MEATESSSLTAVRVSVEELRGEMRQVSALVGGRIDALTERLTAHLDRTDRETTALFAARGEHASRLAEIERTYLPRDQFREFEERNHQERLAILDKLDDVNTRVTKIMAGIGVLVTVVNLGLGPLVKYLTGGHP